MQRKRRRIAAILTVISFLLAGTWQAATAELQVFTDLAAWQAAAGQAAVQLEDFSGSQLGPLPAGKTDIGAFSVFVDTAEAPAPLYHTRIEDFLGNRRFVGSIFPPGPYPGVREMRFEFDRPIVGFSGEWGETLDDDQLTITVDGVKFSFLDFLFKIPPGYGNGFLGFVNPERPFFSVVLGINNQSAFSEGELFLLDNVRLVAGEGVGRPLAVNKSGKGNGTVISSPAGIHCETDCSEPFVEGTAVTLTATPGASSKFTGWSGACKGKGSCVVVVDGPKIVTASFGPGSPRRPLAPSGLSAIALSPQQVQVRWNDNSPDEDTFRLEMRRGQQPFREVASISANQRSVLISSLQPGTRYIFRIRASNTSGFSSYSNRAVVTTPR